MKSLRASGCWLVLSAVWIAMPTCGTRAQQSHPPHAKPAQLTQLSGQVTDEAGNTVSGATVKLESKQAAGSQTVTDDHGYFTFQQLVAESYTVSAESQGKRSKPLAVRLDEAAPSFFKLILAEALDGKVLSDTMTFADGPNFIVSGVTDWTAVGGHGSDATLRTSEDLARATLALQADKAQVMPSGSPEEARLRAAAASDPTSASAKLALGEYLLQILSYQQAFPVLQTASMLSQHEARAEYALAKACNGLGDTAQAKLHIQQALAQKDSAEYHRFAGQLEEELGDPYSAVQHYQRAALLDGSEDSYFAWASELLLHRAVWQAAEIFQKGSLAYPASVRLRTGWGSALFGEARYDLAAQRLCEASDLNPDEVAPYFFLGKVDEAAPASLPCVQQRLARFLQRHPQSADANYFYGMALLRRSGEQSHKETETLLQTAVRLNPEHASALLQLGIFAAARQEYARAIELYKQAVAANPHLAEAHFRLSTAYERIGQPSLAKAERNLHALAKRQDAESVEAERRSIKQFSVSGTQAPSLENNN